MNVAVQGSSAPAEALMRAVLRAGRPIAAEYPLLFEPATPGRVVTVENETRGVLSTCGILVRELVTPAARLRVGLVGSVATDPEHRGRGYGGEALASAEATFAREGCLFSLLWADDPGWYERRGYVPVGSEIDVVLAPRVVEALPRPRGVRHARSSDAPAIHALYAAHPERVERSPAETAALLTAPGMTSLVLERDGAPVAFACRGRGEDLAGTIHEWGGAPADVLALVRAHAREAGGARLVLMVPPTRRDLLTMLAPLGAEGALGVLGMGKLVSTSAAADLLRALAPEARVEARADHVEVHGPVGPIALNETEILLALVSPRLDRRVVEVVEQQTGLAFPALPLAPFVWGLDSI